VGDMTEPAQRGAADQAGSTVTALRSEQQLGLDVAQLVAEHNQRNKTHEKQYARTRQATDAARGAAAAARQADAARDDAEATHEAIQAEEPDRPAPRPRQWTIAGGALLLDGVACYFAAEALGAGQQETVAWAALFLALLGIGEIALDHYSEDHRAAWRSIAVGLGAFIGLLGVLRYSFLATVGTEGLAAAAIGTVLFTAATAGFVLIGYRALRLAEGSLAWRARRHLRAMERAAAEAHRRLDRIVARRDRLASAYLARIRLRLVRTCSSSDLAQLEQVLWAHLVGEDTR
jgi:hypothetical protein